MPHVILEGSITPEDIWVAFQPIEFSEKGNRYKAEEAYLSRDKEDLLIRSISVERGFMKHFFVRVTKKGWGVSMGIEKLAAPDASDGVKRLVGLYAWMILQNAPDVVVGSTNIPDLLGEPKG